MEKQTLHFEETLVDGITYAVMNFFQLVGCLILYLLTIWVPYVNIGTTIAMSYLPVKIANEEAISPTHIFNAGYRKHMSHFYYAASCLFPSFPHCVSLSFLPSYCIGHGRSRSIFFWKKEKAPSRRSKLRTMPPMAANGAFSEYLW